MASEQVAAPQAWSWGPLRAARHLFEELALGPILDGLSATRRHGQPLSERVFVLLANRLTRPGSEHALAQWLEDFYVVTAAGSRWQPQWKQSRRVKVAFEQLRLWYQTLDDLLAHKASIETALWRQLRDLFSLAPELVFYNLTSVAALALLLDRALEKKLRAAGSGLSSAAAWRALETVRVVELELGERRKRCVTRGSRQAAEVLRVLGLRQQLDLPPPPAGQETIM